MFFSGDTEDHFCNIQVIKSDSTVSLSIEEASHEFLTSWKDSHNEMLEVIRDRYDAFGKEGFDRGVHTAIDPDRYGWSGIGASLVTIIIGQDESFANEPGLANFMKHSWDFSTQNSRRKL